MNDHQLTLAPYSVEVPADGYNPSDAWLWPRPVRTPKHRAEDA